MTEPARANTELHRPLPDRNLRARLRVFATDQREKARTRRELRLSRVGDGTKASTKVESGPASRAHALLVTAIIGVGSAAFAIGLLFLWQSWSQRSDPPVDDLLPFLADAPLGIEQPADHPVAMPEPTRPADPNGAVGPEMPSVDAEPDRAVEQIIVHVSGSVVDAGVVELVAGSRVFEAVEAAGGALADADLDRVNLAAPMVDGERIHIPAIGEDVMPLVIEPERPGGAASPVPDSGLESTPLDVNSATSAELESLSGIGPAIAQAIVGTREARGPFLSIDELLEVPGIGIAKLETIRDDVMVSAR